MVCSLSEFVLETLLTAAMRSKGLLLVFVKSLQRPGSPSRHVSVILAKLTTSVTVVELFMQAQSYSLLNPLRLKLNKHSGEAHEHDRDQSHVAEYTASSPHFQAISIRGLAQAAAAIA